jgi:hypothetical protein
MELPRSPDTPPQPSPCKGEGARVPLFKGKFIYQVEDSQR